VNDLALAWDDAASGYDDYFVPRFAPWNEVTIAALAARAAELPPGPILVPCCGPGQELEPLARLGHPLFAIDLSAGMVERARARALAAALPQVTVEVGDATVLAARFPGTAAGVLSCFGLQQLPAPDAGLRDWASTLAPGGVLAVTFWPRGGDDDGPSVLMRRLLGRHLSQPDASWQDRLVPALREAGADLLEDRRVEFVMVHESAEVLWEAITRWGPTRLVARRHGEAFLEALKPDYLAAMGPGPVEQRASARFLLARRPVGR